VDKAPANPPRDILWASYGGGGSGLYRRSVLERVGSFNPYLNSDEEPELGLRIRHAGYRILEIDYPMIRHYNDAPIAVSNVLSRHRRNFLVGIGQGARYHAGSRLFWPWLKERWWGPASFLFFAAALGAMAWTLFSRRVMWLAPSILALAFLFSAVRKRSLNTAIVSAVNWLFMAEGFLRGFLMRPFAPESFHSRVEVIQDIRNRPASADTPPSPIRLLADEPCR
jgi:GT2 family glycosyltransferase